MKESILTLLITIPTLSLGFNPLSIENDLLNELATRLGVQLDRAPGESLSHEDIFRRGLKRSVLKYLNHVHSARLDPHLSLRDLLVRVYGRQCKFGIEHAITNEFEPALASVDLDPLTRDNPVAHFDAERLVESNTRVLDSTREIHELVRRGHLTRARQLTASVLHTIQDFYSHTNWVDLGNRETNPDIGTQRFQTSNPSLDQPFCSDNCEKMQLECPPIVSSILTTRLSCPIIYWKCPRSDIDSSGLRSLTSGYYSNQKLSDGSPVLKPVDRGKCSHGGILDDTATSIRSFGGLNKDSAYYILSPRAHLHEVAANLAIDHTEKYFDALRDQMGDRVFAQFLRLDPSSDLLNKICSLFGI